MGPSQNRHLSVGHEAGNGRDQVESGDEPLLQARWRGAIVTPPPDTPERGRRRAWMA